MLHNFLRQRKKVSETFLYCGLTEDHKIQFCAWERIMRHFLESNDTVVEHTALPFWKCVTVVQVMTGLLTTSSKK